MLNSQKIFAKICIKLTLKIENSHKSNTERKENLIPNANLNMLLVCAAHLQQESGQIAERDTTTILYLSNIIK